MSTLKVNAIEPYSGGTVSITGFTPTSSSYATVAENLTAGDKTHSGVIKETFAAPAGGQTDIFTVTGAVTEGVSYPTYTVGLQDYGGPDFGDAFVTEIFGPGFAYGTGHSVSGKGLFVNVAPNGGGTAGKLRIEDAGGGTSKATIQGTQVQITGSMGVLGNTSQTGYATQRFDDISNNSQIDNLAVNPYVDGQGYTVAYPTFGWQKYGDIHGWLGEQYSGDYSYGTGTEHSSKMLAWRMSPSGSAYQDNHIYLQDNGDTTATIELKAAKVDVKSAMNLTPQDPLPAGTIGDLAVSGSNLFFYNGAWTQVI